MGQFIPTYTLTHSGRKFCFISPETHDYHVGDMAHHLSNVCRYSGACKFYYSVAQHSVLMAEAAYAMTGDPVLSLDCLFHDAAEAYLGDLVTPLKVQMGGFVKLEERTDKALRRHLRQRHVLVPAKQSKECGYLDKALFLTEWQTLMPEADAESWCPGVEPLDVKIEPWTPEEAKEQFLILALRLAKEAQSNLKEPAHA